MINYLKSCLFILVVVGAGCGNAIAQPLPDSMVYLRQERLPDNMANSQHHYDGGINWRHTRTDLVQDYLDGHERVLHACERPGLVCSAQDPRPSPDAKTILYTVAEGDALYPVTTAPGAVTKGVQTPPIEFVGKRYSLWLYDLASGTTKKIRNNARNGAWFNQDTIVWASDDAKTYTPLAHAGPETGYIYPALQIYIGTLKNGVVSDVLNLSPESVGALSPAALPDGRVCWSDWNGFEQRAVGHTPANMVWIKCALSDGTKSMYLLNAHGSPTLKMYAYATDTLNPNRRGEGSTQLRLTRGITYLRNGWYAFVTYYRSNHQGELGDIRVASSLLPIGVEGYSQSRNVEESDYKSSAPGSGRYVPPMYSVCPTCQDQDQEWPKFDKQGRGLGKMGYPSPSPVAAGKMLATDCGAACYEFMWPERSTREAMGGLPTSHMRIVSIMVDKVTDKFDPKQVVVRACADEKYNCYDGWWVDTYENLHGTTPPVRLPTPPQTGVTVLQVVDAKAAESAPIPKGKPQDKISFQGNFADDYAERVTAIRITETFQWKVRPTRQGFDTGRVWNFPLEKDGSVSMTLPCGIEYRLQGVDKDGVAVATDLSLHHATCGEVVTCHGCHDGHSIERNAEINQAAVERFKGTIAGC
ncbi:MAG: hypothetical protein R3E64_03940 [Halioglobus sp.]